MKNAIWIFLFAITVLVMFLPAYSTMQDKKQKNLEYNAKIQELEDQKAQLVEEKRLLEEDPEYLEKVAREKMGIVREGEVVYKLKPIKEE